MPAFPETSVQREALYKSFVFSFGVFPEQLAWKAKTGSSFEIRLPKYEETRCSIKMFEKRVSFIHRTMPMREGQHYRGQQVDNRVYSAALRALRHPGGRCGVFCEQKGTPSR